MFGSRKRKKEVEKAQLVEQITENVIDKVEANEVSVDRKGFFTTAQEDLLDELYAKGGFWDKVDGAIIRIVDNTILERLKNKLPEKYKLLIYKLVDEIMDSLKEK